MRRTPCCAAWRWVGVELSFQPRPEYGMVVLSTPVQLASTYGRAEARFDLSAGQRMFDPVDVATWLIAPPSARPNVRAPR